MTADAPYLQTHADQTHHQPHDGEPRGRRAGAPTERARASSATTSAASDRAWGRTLAEAYHPRSNSMDVLRLVFAVTVAVAHALAIGIGWQPFLWNTDLAGLAVDGFFVLSGFLITASFLRLSPGRYAWHRLLRIMPAFWACLVITALVVAPIVAALEGFPAASVFTGESASWQYVLHNAALYMVDFDVAGHPGGTYQPGVINGALWTLFYEAVCYGMVLVLGLLGALTRRIWMTAGVAVISALMLIAPMSGVDVPGALFWRFFLIFTLGMLAWILQDRIRVTPALTIGAIALLLVSMWLLPDYRPLGGVAFAYLCLVAVVATPALRVRLRTDLSYGMYIWHWPLQVILVLAGALQVMPVIAYVILSVALAACAAWISWHTLEKRALSAKNFRAAA